MDEFETLLSKFEEFKQLLIRNEFFDEQSLSSLLTNTQNNDSETQLTLIIEDIESRDRDQVDRFAIEVRNSQLFSENFLSPSDQSDSIVTNVTKLLVTRFKDLMLAPKACGEEIVVKKAKKIKMKDGVYPMTGRPRGFCFIIDNQLFKEPTLPFRAGSRADADRLSDVFSQLFFDVMRYNNKTGTQMKQLLEDLSKNPVLSNHDALAIIILSHGIKDGIYGTDGDIVSVDLIFDYFNNKNCPLLRNKPKMFFLSACRGGTIDTGVKIKFSPTGTLGPPRKTLGKSPEQEVLATWSDIFVFYSTISGFASLRNTGVGSWFGYELAMALAEHAHEEHLNDLVTIKVGERLQKRTTNVNGETAKQSLETQTKGSVKKVYFNPGLSTIDKNN